MTCHGLAVTLISALCLSLGAAGSWAVPGVPWPRGCAGGPGWEWGLQDTFLSGAEQCGGGRARRGSRAGQLPAGLGLWLSSQQGWGC